MKKIIHFDNPFAIIVLALFFAAAAGAANADATVFRCESEYNRCAIVNTSPSLTIYCLKNEQTWQCTLSTFDGLECSYSSETRKIRSEDLSQISNLCGYLCGSCRSGWVE